MLTRQRTRASSLAGVLAADGPAPAHADKLNLYGQFVGDWETDRPKHRWTRARRGAVRRSLRATHAVVTGGRQRTLATLLAGVSQ